MTLNAHNVCRFLANRDGRPIVSRLRSMSGYSQGASLGRVLVRVIGERMRMRFLFLKYGVSPPLVALAGRSSSLIEPSRLLIRLMRISGRTKIPYEAGIESHGLLKIYTRSCCDRYFVTPKK
jgi:hypothetical protein